VFFGPDRTIIFHRSEGGHQFVFHMKDDETQQEKLLSYPDLIMKSVSPDGQWIIALGSALGKERPTAVFAYPIHGGTPVRVCTYCDAAWSHDGRFFFVRFRAEGSGEGGKVFVIAQAPGRPTPNFPSGGVEREKDLSGLSVFGSLTSRVFHTLRLLPILRYTRFLVSAFTATSTRYHCHEVLDGNWGVSTNHTFPKPSLSPGPSWRAR
jgi:hypothetical protein